MYSVFSDNGSSRSAKYHNNNVMMMKKNVYAYDPRNEKSKVDEPDGEPETWETLKIK